MIYQNWNLFNVIQKTDIELKSTFWIKVLRNFRIVKAQREGRFSLQKELSDFALERWRKKTSGKEHKSLLVSPAKLTFVGAALNNMR